MERRKFSREFKLAADKKVLEQGLSHCEVARELGIRDTYIHNWGNSFEKDGTLAAEVKQEVSESAELKRLREESRHFEVWHPVRPLKPRRRTGMARSRHLTNSVDINSSKEKSFPYF